MQLTNSLVSICCNNVLSTTGGDIYISVMTIISSIRQLVETPIYAMNEGSSPILSYNYGARRPKRVKQAILTMALMIFVYTGAMWSVIILAPHFLIPVSYTHHLCRSIQIIDNLHHGFRTLTHFFRHTDHIV